MLLPVAFLSCSFAFIVPAATAHYIAKAGASEAVGITLDHALDSFFLGRFPTPVSFVFVPHTHPCTEAMTSNPQGTPRDTVVIGFSLFSDHPAALGTYEVISSQSRHLRPVLLHFPSIQAPKHRPAYQSSHYYFKNYLHILFEPPLHHPSVQPDATALLQQAVDEGKRAGMPWRGRELFGIEVTRENVLQGTGLKNELFDEAVKVLQESHSGLMCLLGMSCLELPPWEAYTASAERNGTMSGVPPWRPPVPYLLYMTKSLTAHQALHVRADALGVWDGHGGLFQLTGATWKPPLRANFTLSPALCFNYVLNCDALGLIEPQHYSEARHAWSTPPPSFTFQLRPPSDLEVGFAFALAFFCQRSSLHKSLFWLIVVSTLLLTAVNSPNLEGHWLSAV